MLTGVVVAGCGLAVHAASLSVVSWRMGSYVSVTFRKGPKAATVK